MPVIGDSSRFAVEFALDEQPGGEWMFGRLCFWCAGRPIGDFAVGTSLRDALFALEEVLKGKGRRANPRFSAVPTAQAFRALNACLFGAGGDDDAEVAENEGWAWHDILPRIDVFDRWKGFLIEDESRASLVLAEFPYENPWTVELTPGEVDVVLDAARASLATIYAASRHLGAD